MIHSSRQMPRSELFYQYLKKSLDRLEKSHQEYFETGDEPLLFKIRVSIKKIRASIKCLEHYNGLDRYKETRKQLKKIFELGGHLRTLKNYDEWLRRHNLVRLSRQIELPDRIEKREKAFSHAREKNDKIIRDIRKHLLKDAQAISQKQVDHFYLLLLKARIHILMENSPSQKWHAERKEMKRIIYARHWQGPSTVRLLSEAQSAFLNRIQHQIGDWHDHEEMLDWIKKQKKEYSNSRDNILNKYFAKAIHIMESMQVRRLKRVMDSRNKSAEVFQTFLKRFKGLPEESFKKEKN